MNTIEAGGFSRLSKASNSWFGTNSFGVNPIDHAGNWQSYAIAGARTAVCCGMTKPCRSATAMAEMMFGVAYGPMMRSTSSWLMSRS